MLRFTWIETKQQRHLGPNNNIQELLTAKSYVVASTVYESKSAVIMSSHVRLQS